MHDIAGGILDLDRHCRRDGLPGNRAARLLDEHQLGGSAGRYIKGSAGGGGKSAAGGTQSIAGPGFIQGKVAKGGHTGTVNRTHRVGSAQGCSARVVQDG